MSVSTRRSDVENLLGQEFTVLVADTWQGFNPELFCALAGTVRAPGLVVLFTPPLEHWPQIPDPDYDRLCSWPYCRSDVQGRFIQYFINQIIQMESHGGVSIIEQDIPGDKRIISIYKENIGDITSDTGNGLVPGTGQKDFICKFRRLLRGDDGILLLCARRGRGKSTALGMALEQAIATGILTNRTIHLISQTRRNLESLFNVLAKTGTGNCRIEILPPDQALVSAGQADLAIVDEAAAIPLPQLEKLIHRNSRLVLSTTLDGYEGSGMGFERKLLARENIRNRVIASVELSRPYRWSRDDPVEYIVEHTLMPAKAQFPNPDKITGIFDRLVIEPVDRDRLARDTEYLHRVFSLLANAHYRTTPDDLRYLMDAPDARLWQARNGTDVAGVLLACAEGGLPRNLGQAIRLGFRRVRGHLIPQTLALNTTATGITRIPMMRIVRIAVDREYRRRGIARSLIKSLVADTSRGNNGVHVIGASFGLDPELYAFWKANGFSPVRLGYRANARSGQRSMVMLKNLNPSSAGEIHTLCEQFCQELAFQKRVSPHNPVTSALFEDCSNSSGTRSALDGQIRECLYGFAFGRRPFESSHRLLFEAIRTSAGRKILKEDLDQEQSSLFKLKVLENAGWAHCARTLGCSGRDETLDRLRRACRKFYTSAWGNRS